MYCKFCGNTISEDTVFCSHCGQRLISEDTQPTNKFVGSKSFIALLWWTLLVLILGIILYSDSEDFENVIPLFPIYFGVILLVYTKRFHKKTQDMKKSPDDNDQDDAKDVTGYSLQKFSEIYGKMQICRYQDDYGVTRSKCVFTRSIDVYFGSDIGELNAKEIVENKELLLVQKKLYGDGYVLTVKDGKTIIRQPSSSVLPPLDKVSDKN